MSPFRSVTLLVAGIGLVAGLEPCVIDCTHGDTFTADPVNCKNYYICYSLVENSEYPFTCDGNTYFDTSSNTCIESGYTCTPECEKCSFDCGNPNFLGIIASQLDCGVYFTCDTSEYTTCDSSTPFFDGNACQAVQQNCCTCKSLCTQDDVDNHIWVPDYHNCTNYYLCLEEGIPDETTHGHCPSGNFNQQTFDCDINAPCIQPCA